jgi:hypothetical protein
MTKHKGGRPVIKLDWELVDGLCKLQCTIEEIASLAKCSVDTLDRAARREHKMGFAEYYRQKALGGLVSLRRAQFKSALGGNVTAQIWLGKQLLGQREQRDAPPSDPHSIAHGIRELADALFAVEPLGGR